MTVKSQGVHASYAGITRIRSKGMISAGKNRHPCNIYIRILSLCFQLVKRKSYFNSYSEFVIHFSTEPFPEKSSVFKRHISAVAVFLRN